MTADPGPVRVYADSSVFGGAFDAEFAESSRAFFKEVWDGRFRLLTSAVVQAELESAPAPVQTLFTDLLPLMEIADVPETAWDLQRAYIDAGIISPRSAVDALHVALATVLR